MLPHLDDPITVLQYFIPGCAFDLFACDGGVRLQAHTGSQWQASTYQRYLERVFEPESSTFVDVELVARKYIRGRGPLYGVNDRVPSSMLDTWSITGVDFGADGVPLMNLDIVLDVLITVPFESGISQRLLDKNIPPYVWMDHEMSFSDADLQKMYRLQEQYAWSSQTQYLMSSMKLEGV